MPCSRIVSFPKRISKSIDLPSKEVVELNREPAFSRAAVREVEALQRKAVIAKAGISWKFISEHEGFVITDQKGKQADDGLH